MSCHFGVLIDEVERIWSAIDERDDWSALDDKIAAIRELGRQLGPMPDLPANATPSSHIAPPSPPR